MQFYIGKLNKKIKRLYTTIVIGLNFLIRYEFITFIKSMEFLHK